MLEAEAGGTRGQVQPGLLARPCVRKGIKEGLYFLPNSMGEEVLWAVLPQKGPDR